MRRVALVVTICLVSALPGPASAQTAVVVVDTTSLAIDGDTSNVTKLLERKGADMKVSLREALRAVNNTGPGQTILFDLPHGAQIFLTGTEYLLQPNTVVDGDSISSRDGLPDVVINAPDILVPILVATDSNEFRNLALANAMSFRGDDAHHNLVVNSYIGTDVDGRNPLNVDGGGVELALGAHDNVIRANVIAGVGSPGSEVPYGVLLWGGAHDNVIRGNRIGLNVDGVAVANGVGVAIYQVDGVSAQNNVIGGSKGAFSCEDPCNLIAGNFDAGVHIEGADATGNQVAGNAIGLGADLRTPIGNVLAGVRIAGGASGNVVGGDRPSILCEGPCNVISAQYGYGVEIAGASTHDNAVRGNLIGNAETAFGVPNRMAAVAVLDGASSNTIGGERDEYCRGPCNEINGNAQEAVLVEGSGTADNRILGNIIGANERDSVPEPNGTDGYPAVAVRSGATRTIVGGDRPGTACTGPCNLIDANAFAGVLVAEAGTADNQIRGNDIGRNIGNGGPGILIDAGATNTIVGGIRPAGDCTGPCSRIRRNKGPGVRVSGPGIGNQVVANEIWGNDGISIDLAASDRNTTDHVTPNDETDADEGPNGLLNFPVGVTAYHDRWKDETIVSGIVQGGDPRTVRVDLYATESVHPFGFGEGQYFLGSATIDNDAGVFRKKVTLPPSAPFVSATVTDAFGSTSEFSPVCGDPDDDGSPDTDGDGACDDWESPLSGIDYDGDGTVDLDLRGRYGASRTVKDVFVEVDWMADPGHSHEPTAAAMAAARASFLRSPVDAGNGIALHTEMGEPVPEIPDVAFEPRGPGTADDFDDIKLGSNNPVELGSACGARMIDGHFGTLAERRSADCWKILGARALVLRYALFAHRLAGRLWSGQAEMDGNDFVVTLARVVAALGPDDPTIWDTPRSAELADIEAATFLHELGHSVGLRHGGGRGIPESAKANREVNCKPNYGSVMSYSRQFNEAGSAISLDGIADGEILRTNRTLDYSRATVPFLDETALNEPAGAGGAPGDRMLFGGPAGKSLIGPAGAPVSWNGDEDASDDAVHADVNFIVRLDGCAASPGQPALLGHDDWSNLVYPFRQDPDFAGGVHTVDDLHAELTDAEFIDGYLGGRDVDGDGVPNRDDTCPLVNNPGQEADACASPARADLSVSETDAPDPVYEGGDVTYAIAVHNAGPDDAGGVAVTDDVVGTFVIGALRAGETKTVTAVVRAERPGVLLSTPRVTGNVVDPMRSNDATMQATTVLPCGPLRPVAEVARGASRDVADLVCSVGA
jgi:hypothetical protein